MCKKKQRNKRKKKKRSKSTTSSHRKTPKVVARNTTAPVVTSTTSATKEKKPHRGSIPLCGFLCTRESKSWRNNSSIARGQLRSHAERSSQFAAGPNFLNSLLAFKTAWFVMIGQAPARFDAKKRSTIRQQRQIRYAG